MFKACAQEVVILAFRDRAATQKHGHAHGLELNRQRGEAAQPRRFSAADARFYEVYCTDPEVFGFPVRLAENNTRLATAIARHTRLKIARADSLRGERP